MGWQAATETVCRMDATSERTWTYLQRVTATACQFMSRSEMSPPRPNYDQRRNGLKELLTNVFERQNIHTIYPNKH